MHTVGLTPSTATCRRLSAMLAELAELGGQALTVQTTRSPVTWSTQTIQTHEDYDHNKRTGEHGPTGRHRAAASVLIKVRDFALLDAVATVLTSRDEVEVHTVNWSVDEDNPDWALLRADAIHAALLKGQDYAFALGGSIVRVEHVADAGLLGSDTPAHLGRDPRVTLAASRAESGAVSLDPVPQVLSATIEARLIAVVGPYPSDDRPPSCPRSRRAGLSSLPRNTNLPGTSNDSAAWPPTAPIWPAKRA